MANLKRRRKQMDIVVQREKLNIESVIKTYKFRFLHQWKKIVTTCPTVCSIIQRIRETLYYSAFTDNYTIWMAAMHSYKRINLKA